MTPAAVYLDYAATAAIRPEEVADAVYHFLREVGATPGRAGHAPALAAGRIALRCRLALAELFAIEGDPGRIAFQLNATHALNSALAGFLRPGDAVVRTQYDHNSVRRPVLALASGGVEERVLSGSPDGGVDLDELDLLLRGDNQPARLLAIPHASNVLGSVLPVAAMAERAHAVGARVLVDAAQTAGHLPIDVERMGVDLLAFTGHKGLLGPQGTGGLWVREGVEISSLLHGGTGADSAAPAMPATYPDHLEAGSQNAPGIAGLLAGVEWVQRSGVAALHLHESTLADRLIAGIRGIDAVTIHSPTTGERVGIVTINCEGVPAAALATRLERQHQVLTRSGLHCAPGAHEVLGTLETGAVRLSTGWATTESEIDRAVLALADLCARRENE
jgi:cysteine desulfurase family protein